MITVSHGLAMVGIDSLGAYAKTISEFEDLPVANWELAHMKLFALKVNFCSMTTNVAFKRRAEASIRCTLMAKTAEIMDEELDWRTFYQCFRMIPRGSSERFWIHQPIIEGKVT